MDLLADPILYIEDLVYGLGGGVVNVCDLGSLRDVHAFLLDEKDEESAFVVWYGHVFFRHS